MNNSLEAAILNSAAVAQNVVSGVNWMDAIDSKYFKLLRVMVTVPATENPLQLFDGPKAGWKKISPSCRISGRKSTPCWDRRCALSSKHERSVPRVWESCTRWVQNAWYLVWNCGDVNKNIVVVESGTKPLSQDKSFPLNFVNFYAYSLSLWTSIAP